jgi:hypothetical protein
MGRGLHLSEYSLIRHGFSSVEATAVRIIEGLQNCAAVFRYLREYALMIRDESMVICLDDKHRLKVGEPGYPVTVAERGRWVIISLHKEFQVF